MPRATATGLAPGRYRFRVAATVDELHWSEGEAVPVRVLPGFHQTRWFLIVCIAAAAVYGAYVLRRRQLEARFQVGTGGCVEENGRAQGIRFSVPSSFPVRRGPGVRRQSATLFKSTQARIG